MTEADTCRKFVVPLLQKAGWDNDPHSISEIVREFGGPDRLRSAVIQLQTLLYAA
ncbi:MAG: hypothetical protein ACLQU3_26180 [Limisphaerales bacterium]